MFHNTATQPPPFSSLKSPGKNILHILYIIILWQKKRRKKYISFGGPPNNVTLFYWKEKEWGKGGEGVWGLGWVVAYYIDLHLCM